MNDIEVMLDLESMGVGVKPALIQVAAVAFNKVTGEEISTFDYKVDLSSSMSYGLDITASTIKFWMTHPSVNDETRGIVMSGTDTLTEVLGKFSNWYTSLSDDKCLVWGNGVASDNVWLRSAYDATDLSCPFTFREDMCLRTVRSIANAKGYERLFSFEGNQHDGLDDCRYQIQDLIEIKEFLNI